MTQKFRPPPPQPQQVYQVDPAIPLVAAGRHAPEIAKWLEKPQKLVTRGELWEMLGRYEAGRRRFEAYNRRSRRWWYRLARASWFLWRRLQARFVGMLVQLFRAARGAQPAASDLPDAHLHPPEAP